MSINVCITMFPTSDPWIDSSRCQRSNEAGKDRDEIVKATDITEDPFLNRIKLKDTEYSLEDFCFDPYCCLR